VLIDRSRVEITLQEGFVYIKVAVCLLGCFFCTAIRTWAQDFNKVDVFTGYSYVRAHPANETDQPSVIFAPSPLPNFNMHGGDGSIAYNFDRFNRCVSGVFDFSGYRTSQESALVPGWRSNMYTFLAGPRISFRNSSRFTPFTQVLFGAGASTSGLYFQSNQTVFAMTVGGGIDYRLNHRLSLRPMQVDYMLTHFKEGEDFYKRPIQNNLKVGVGLVFHFL
jgi:hypothetical protein